MKLPNWEKIHVVQRDVDLGCIPSGIEWMIRYKGIEIPNIDKFQEKFNLEAQGIAPNNFKTIKNAVENEYPQLKFKFMSFPHGQGKEKLNEIQKAIENGIPCLISINKIIFNEGGYHIVPVLEIDDKELKVDLLDSDRRVPNISRHRLEWAHNNFQGGDDILMLL